MKIGILTFTEGYNYGNKLQNYALLTYLNDNFPCEAKTINNHITQGSLLQKSILYLKWFVPSKKHFAYWKRLINFNKFNKAFLKFTKSKLYNNSKSFSEIDCFVCGSDQIWNPNYYNSIDLLTGNLLYPKRSISYAASFGINNLPENKKNSFKNALKNLDAISVREIQGVEICNDLGFNECSVNIDPTFLISEEEWIKVLKKPSKELPKKYIATYFLGNIDKENEIIINDYCSKINAKRIDLNSVNSLEWFDIDPFEFLYVIKNAEFVFTDSFHASVFSIIFNKKFLTANRNSNSNNKMNSRIDTLFNMFKCTDHFMNKANSNLDNLTLDRQKVKDIIEYEISRTNNYFIKELFK